MIRYCCFAVTAALVAAPVPVIAQACIGIPTAEGSLAVVGGFATTDGAKGFGGTLHGNLEGPISIQAGYTLWDLDDIDENFNAFHAALGMEVPNLSFSACPFVGAEYATWSESAFGVDVEITQTVIPVGLGIGKSFAAGPALDFTLFAAPQFMYIRTKGSVSDGTDSFSDTESGSEFGLGVGFRMGTQAVFGGAGVSFNTIEESDPTFSLSIGLGFGGAR